MIYIPAHLPDKLPVVVNIFFYRLPLVKVHVFIQRQCRIFPFLQIVQPLRAWYTKRTHLVSFSIPEPFPKYTSSTTPYIPVKKGVYGHETGLTRRYPLLGVDKLPDHDIHAKLNGNEEKYETLYARASTTKLVHRSTTWTQLTSNGHRRTR